MQITSAALPNSGNAVWPVARYALDLKQFSEGTVELSFSVHALRVRWAVHKVK
jgi:hypothetical protein